MGQLKIIRCTNAERIAYGGLEPGRMAVETDTDLVYIGTAGGDVPIGVTAGETYWNPDALPGTPSTQDDHFKAGALDPKWTEFDPIAPAITVSVADTFLIITHATEGVGSHRGVYQTLPAGDFTIVGKCALIGNLVGSQSFGVCLFEDATDPTKAMIIHKSFYVIPASLYRHLTLQLFSDYDTFSATYAGPVGYPNTTVYLRIRRNGTNLYYEYSSDGVSWQMIYTHVQPWAPAHMGLVTNNDNTGLTVYGYFDLFRYIASDQIGPIGVLE